MNAVNCHLDLDIRDDQVAANWPYIYDALGERSARELIEHLGNVGHHLVPALEVSYQLGNRRKEVPHDVRGYCI